jgi:hypothetical protein
MVRSIWLRTVAALLASTGLVCAQQSAAPPMAPAHPGEKIISVQEMDRPALKCRIIRMWHTADGALAYQVQALDTGELLTVVESAPLPQQPGSRVRAVATRIYHWGRTGQPPAGTPMPPPDDVADIVDPSGPPIMPTRASDPGTPWPQPSAGPAMRAWPPAYADQAAPATSGPPPASAPVRVPQAMTAPRIAPQPAESPACECTPCTPQRCECSPCSPQIVEMPDQVPASPEGSGRRTRFASIRSLLAPPKETVTMTATAGPQASAPAEVAEAMPATERAQPGDWRQSWGKPDYGRGAGTGQAAARYEMPDTPLPPRSEYTQAEFPSAPAPMPSRSSRTATGPDPLRDPETYSRNAAQDESSPGRSGFPEGPPSPASAAAPGPRVPLGTQSVFQAGSPQYVPVPVMTVPDYRRPPEPPPPRIPQAPEPTKFDPSNAFTQPGSNNPAPLMPQAANAFTPAPPTGPTPDTSGAFPAAPGGYPPGFDRHIYGNPMGQGMPYPTPPGSMNPPGYLPTPPAPAGQGVRPVAYAEPAPAQALSPAPATTPAARPTGAPDALLPRPGTLATPDAIGMLRESMYPSQREWAALKLGSLDWRANPEAVLGLVTTAHHDPAPSVRAACVRSLAQMRVNTMPVVNAIQALKTDPDPRVQRAAEEALALLAPESAAPSAAPGQPASGLVPAKSN